MSDSLFSNDHIRAILSIAPDRRNILRERPAPDARCLTPPGMSEDCTPESHKFFTAWRLWRGTQLLPSRQQVNLTSIARLMPQLIVLEVHGPDRAIFRLAGTEIEAQFGARLTGRSVIALAEPEKQKRRGELLWQQVSQPCAMIVCQEMVFRSGRRETVEIAAAPVLPGMEGQPVQLFAVVSRLPRHQPAAATEAGRDMVVGNFGRNLRFVDIGAGLPRAA